MVSNWLKGVVMVLILVDLWLTYEAWTLLDGGFWGIIFLTFGFFNFCLGMGLSQMSFLSVLRKDMEEDEEIEVHTFRYAVEKEPQPPSKVIQLVDSEHGMEFTPDLPPVS